VIINKIVVYERFFTLKYCRTKSIITRKTSKKIIKSSKIIHNIFYILIFFITFLFIRNYIINILALISALCLFSLYPFIVLSIIEVTRTRILTMQNKMK
jgi:hypothetical protein